MTNDDEADEEAGGPTIAHLVAPRDACATVFGDDAEQVKDLEQRLAKARAARDSSKLAWTIA